MSSSKKDDTESPVLPDDVIEKVLTFLPIKEAIKAGLVSKRFLKAWLFCCNLDFGGDYFANQPFDACKDIIEKVLERNKASMIKRLALALPYTYDNQHLIESWIHTCTEKGLEELDFKVLNERRYYVYIFEPRIELSVIQSLEFVTTLSFSHIKTLSNRMIAAICKTCFLLSNLELVRCRGVKELWIDAWDHTKLKSLTVVCCSTSLFFGVANAPMLKSLKYAGYFTNFKFTKTWALKDLMLHFIKKKKNLAFQRIDLSRLHDIVHIEVLTISDLFLEGLAWILNENPQYPFRFNNLKEVQLLVEGLSFCNLYDIASFIKHCPSVERIYIDVNAVNCKPGVYREWRLKSYILSFPYVFGSLRFLEMRGFKNHWHEFDIVEFFLERSPNIAEIALVSPNRARAKVHAVNRNRMRALSRMKPWVKVTRCDHARYNCAIPPIHMNRWYF